MFVNDYVKTKYNAIYVEAATLYNKLNQKYPRKPDLRKTVEYRRWKNEISVQNNMPTTPIPRQKPRQCIHMIHPNISIDTTTTSSPHTTASPPIDLSTMEVSINETQQTAQNPVPQNPPPAEKQSADHLDKRLTGMTMQLSIPLIQIPTSSTKPVQHPDQIIPAAYQETVISEGDQAEVLDPSILDDILPETMEKIIRELQSDPNLSDIMEDIENRMNIEEEIPDLTVDLPELDDLLEDELMLW